MRFWLAIFILFAPFGGHSDSSRILVTLGPCCDFSANKIGKKIDAIILKGNEEELIQKIESYTKNKIIILDSPIENLSDFARKIFYDQIELNAPFSQSLQQLIAKINSSPKTSNDLPTINPKQRGEFYQLMIEVDQLFNENQIAYWGMFGTLLGAIRHEGMIPWDDDLDLIIKYNDRYQLEKLLPLLHKKGLELINYGNLFYKIYPLKGKDILDEQGQKLPWKYPFMDIFLISKFNEQFHVVSIDNPQQVIYPAKNYNSLLITSELHYPINRVKFGPILLPIPHNPSNVLTRLYGTDWKNTAYMQHCHEKEKALHSIKVSIVDFSSPEFILPKKSFTKD